MAIDLGKIYYTTPEGDEFCIEGNKVCVTSSPDKCWEESPEEIQMRFDVARHEGWPIRRELTMFEAYRRHLKEKK